MALILGGLDIVGDDMDGEDDYGGGHMSGLSTVGRAKRRRAAAAAQGGGQIQVATPRWMNATTSQGVSRPQEDLDFLSFTPLTILAGGANGTLTSQPQRPFRGERLILTAVNITGGADVSGTATINPAIFVGAVQVGSTQGATPFQAFRADAFGVRLSWPAAGQGTTINIPVVLTTVAAAGGVAIAGTVFGRAMR
ncbi:MAG TPA: hypothetical protein VNG33_07275 [Polyangiaceae bacterium]|jgi:hypothetical protein|nr:hypothetical protein [Polyangiaceae bacterium]